jgi:DNA-binding transcriptional LysR family regulator
MTLDPWRLRLLTQFADRGTVRAVAAALSLSPSAVSQQLAVLEREAKATLLDRHGRRLVLTPDGRRLVEHARDILDRIDVAERDLADRGVAPVGPVRIAAFSSALSSLVIPALPRLAAAHPRLEPSTVELEPHESVPALLRGECDLAVVADVGDTPLPRGAPVVTIPLTTDPLVTVVGADRAAPPDLTELAEAPWVLDTASSYLSDLVLRRCRQAGFEPRVVARYRSFGMMLQHVETGAAVTVLPALAIDPRYRVHTAVLEPVVRRAISVVVRAGAAPRPAVQVVVDALRPR